MYLCLPEIKLPFATIHFTDLNKTNKLVEWPHMAVHGICSETGKPLEFGLRFEPTADYAEYFGKDPAGPITVNEEIATLMISALIDNVSRSLDGSGNSFKWYYPGAPETIAVEATPNYGCYWKVIRTYSQIRDQMRNCLGGVIARIGSPRNKFSPGYQPPLETFNNRTSIGENGEMVSSMSFYYGDLIHIAFGNSFDMTDTADTSSHRFYMNIDGASHKVFISGAGDSASIGAAFVESLDAEELQGIILRELYSKAQFLMGGSLASNYILHDRKDLPMTFFTSKRHADLKELNDGAEKFATDALVRRRAMIRKAAVTEKTAKAIAAKPVKVAKPRAKRTTK